MVDGSIDDFVVEDFIVQIQNLGNIEDFDVSVIVDNSNVVYILKDTCKILEHDYNRWYLEK